MSDGELQVQDPKKLQGYHVLNLTGVAVDENRLCNHSYLDVKVTLYIKCIGTLFTCIQVFVLKIDIEK